MSDLHHASGHSQSALPPRLLISGLDSLYVSYFLGTSGSDLDFDELAYQRELVRTKRGEFSEIDLGSERFALMPYGRKPYAYVLANRAFEVRLAERLQPSCHVQFFSEALWTDGVGALRARIAQWCDSLNLKPVRQEKIARADWAFDYHLPIIDFTADSFVSRATKDAVHRERGRPQTFRMGQGQVVVRVYDKVAEIEQQSDKVWLHQLWGRQDEVWRIEFQVRGERLSEGGIRTLDDLADLQADLLRELATEHTTLRAPTGDSNRSRWPLHPLWKALIRHIAELPQMGLVRSYDERTALIWRRNKQLRSIEGYLKGFSAVVSLIRGEPQPLPLRATVETALSLLEEEHSETLWDQEVSQRMKAYWLGKW